jgi:hypothetical protein
VKRLLLRFFVILLIASTALLPGCATMKTAGDPAAELRGIAVDYWKSRLEERLDKTYEMEDREGLPRFEEYRVRALAMKRLNIVSHAVREVKMEGDKGLVNVEVSFLLPVTTKPIKETIRDQWIRKEGTWLHLFTTK